MRPAPARPAAELELDPEIVSIPDTRRRRVRDPSVKECKRAEFLVHESFPWELVDEIGVADAGMLRQVMGILAEAAHKPVAECRPLWYY